MPGRLQDRPEGEENQTVRTGRYQQRPVQHRHEVLYEPLHQPEHPGRHHPERQQRQGAHHPGRQPEAEGKIRSTFMLGLVFIETVVIYALIIGILIIFVL